MIGLVTNCKPFFGDVCDEIRLFFVEKKIDEVNEAGQTGLFVLVHLDEDENWHAACRVILDGNEVYSYEDRLPCVSGSALYIKKIKKRFIKNAVYTLLKGYTKRKPPWGSLTGIRPTKLARELLAEMDGDAWGFFTSEFDVDASKAKLAFDIVENQTPVINGITPADIDVYVGIPFCLSRCSYCSFVSQEVKRNKNLTNEYLDSLIWEIQSAKRILQERNIRCIYVGGGTPTALGAAQLTELFDAIRREYPDSKEFTVEAGRPDTIDADRLEAIRSAGATRICVNAQTTNPETLQRIGRLYEPGEFGRAFDLARKFGFNNINTDIIVGLPGEKIGDVQQTLKDVCVFEPENVTVHTLAIKNAANLTLTDAAGFADADIVSRMVEYSREYLQSRGYVPYYMYRQKYMAGNLENVGYAKPGNICAYNIDIMEELVDNISFGAGAMSKRIFTAQKRIERSCNIKDVKQYIESIDEMTERKCKLFSDL